MSSRLTVIGIDQSISGTGVVILRGNEVIHHTLIQIPTDLKKIANYLHLDNRWVKTTKPYKRGLIDENWKRLKKAKDLTKEEKDLFKVPQSLRTHIITHMIDSIVTTYNPTLAGMEEPAFGASGQLASLGSLLGQIQNVMFSQWVPYQTINIARVKVFATGKGNALKETMIAAIPDRHRHILDDYDDKVVDNIADAYWIASYMQDQAMKYSLSELDFDIRLEHLIEGM